MAATQTRRQWKYFDTVIIMSTHEVLVKILKELRELKKLLKQ